MEHTPNDRELRRARLTEKERAKMNNRRFRLLVNSILLLLAAILYASLYKIYAAESAVAVIHILTDAFLVPGVLFSCFSLLGLMASKGVYDSFGYVFYNFGLHTIWITKPKEKYETLYDYKVAKDKKGREWRPELLIVGLGGILISVIFFIIYNCMT